MTRVVFRTRARNDLDAIAEYIARDGIDRAIDFTFKLQDACRTLDLFPERGALVGASRNKRRLVHGNYNIFYRVDGGTVIVLRIIEGHRSVGRHDIGD